MCLKNLFFRTSPISHQEKLVGTLNTGSWHAASHLRPCLLRAGQDTDGRATHQPHMRAEKCHGNTMDGSRSPCALGLVQIFILLPDLGQITDSGHFSDPLPAHVAPSSPPLSPNLLSYTGGVPRKCESYFFCSVICSAQQSLSQSQVNHWTPSL